jgi:hypothetical protein
VQLKRYDSPTVTVTVTVTVRSRLVGRSVVAPGLKFSKQTMTMLLALE